MTGTLLKGRKFPEWGKKRVGILNGNWKNGRYMSSRGYILIRKPDHPSKGQAGGYVGEHILVYEECHKCCILKWGVIHHIDGNKSNNNLANLELTGPRHHTEIHSRLDMRDRRCRVCRSWQSTTYKLKSGYVVSHWYGNPDEGFICGSCYHKQQYFKRKAVG